MILSDLTIRSRANEIFLEGYQSEHVEPASYDCTLGNTFQVAYASLSGARDGGAQVFDPKGVEGVSDISSFFFKVVVGEGKGLLLDPGDFVLAATREVLSVPKDLVARVEGRSSVGRVGVMVHITAGFIDPGFSGTITLEIYNAAPYPIIIYPGSRICQLCFYPTDRVPAAAYGQSPRSKYQAQREPTLSRLANDFKDA